ncbi:sensor histidine kinase [Chitinophaga lutea]
MTLVAGAWNVQQLKPLFPLISGGGLLTAPWVLCAGPMLALAVTAAVFLLAWCRIRRKYASLLRESRGQINRQAAQIRQMQVMLKMKVLHARMNPHFLFNSLNAVQYFINADDKKTALQYMSRFAGFLRRMLQLGDEVAISLKEETELMEDYLGLEQARFPDRFTWEIDLPEELWLEDIPPFLLHGLLEEALYKGVLHLEGGQVGKISVALRQMEEGYAVEVRDNGVMGRRTQEEDERSEQFYRRIQLFNEQNIRTIRLQQRVSVIEEGNRVNKAVLSIT